MDLNQLYRDWTNADSMANNVMKDMNNLPSGVSALKAIRVATTAGLSWSKVQESHLKCLHKGEDRRTGFMLNQFFTRWRRNHRSMWEQWDDIVDRVRWDDVVTRSGGKFTGFVEAETHVESDQDDEEEDTNDEEEDPLHNDDDVPEEEHQKITVQHMEIHRIRLGSGWKTAKDSTFTLTYYDHEQRVGLTTKIKKLDAKKKRGGHVQFLWSLDLIWRVWTSRPRGTKADNIVVHFIFASPPTIREVSVCVVCCV